MAIIIEEKKNEGTLINLAIWIVIALVIVVSIYYVFFRKPELVEFTASGSFKNIQQLSKISINSDQLINNTQFQALKPYITVSTAENIGRSNPFLGF